MNKINLIDYIHSDDLIAYADYLKHFHCDKCKLLMIQPTFCSFCDVNGRTTCFECRCAHEIKKPRHISCLLDKIRFKCKYCDRLDLHYNDLIEHKNKYHSNSQSLPLVISVDDIDNNYSNNKATSVNDLNEFYVYADDIINDINSLKQINDDITNDIKMKIEDINMKYNSLLLEVKKMNKEHLMNSSNKENDSAVESVLNKIGQYEETIHKKHNDLDKEISSLTQQLQLLVEENYILNNKRKTQHDCEYKRLLMENDWLKDYTIAQSLNAQSMYFPCSLCGETVAHKSLFKCIKCQCYYCLNKCANKCLGSNCTNYLCLKDSIKCSLCLNKNYCDKCLIKCFYIKCSNYFCLECYSKNEHQKRDNNESCKLIQCESCSNEMCIMTSLNCNKCDIRLCLVCQKFHLH